MGLLAEKCRDEAVAARRLLDWCQVPDFTRLEVAALRSAAMSRPRVACG